MGRFGDKRAERENFGPRRVVAVRRFVREARGYWRFQRAKTRRRMLVAVGLAEGEELASNGLLSWSAQKSTWERDWGLTRLLKRQGNFDQRKLQSPFSAHQLQIRECARRIRQKGIRGPLERPFGLSGFGSWVGARRLPATALRYILAGLLLAAGLRMMFS